MRVKDLLTLLLDKEQLAYIPDELLDRTLMVGDRPVRSVEVGDRTLTLHPVAPKPRDPADDWFPR